MAGAKDIKRRIKSIGNTKKITKAMEMVSAVKMRKSVLSAVQVRPYARTSLLVFSNLAGRLGKDEHPFLKKREINKELVLIITSNRGLCGNFNSQILKKVYEKARDKKDKIDFITIGKKGETTLRNRDFNIIASFNNLSYIPKVEEVRPIVKIITEGFLGGSYDKVEIVYADYKSAILSVPRLRQLLPVSKEELVAEIDEMNILGKEYVENNSSVQYKIEPTPKDVLDSVIPRIIEMQIYHAILESKASEESARMMAMKNATDAALDMISSLNSSYNKARQAKITQEISEISAGRAALEE